MTALPRRLAAWAQPLDAFADEAQLAFGPWLPALERLLGPDGLDSAQAAGEPNGFDGLGRRGPYERLALSEWGLLDLAPDEFIRRAASAEHLFHQIARVSPTGGGRVVALFDAGPLQLGAPRLAHVAWLVVLARRARRRGVGLVWGVLQAPEQPLRAGDNADAIRALLAARSPRAAGPDAIAAWAAQLGHARDNEERWLITAAIDRRAEETLAARGLAVAEADVPGEHSLRVQAGVAGGTRNQAALALPPPAACARLLRDPLRADPSAQRPGPSSEDDRFAAGAQVLFAVSGNHLLGRLESGELLALQVSGRAKRDPPRPVGRASAPGGNEVVAAGWRWGRLYIATVVDGRVLLHAGQRGHWRQPTASTPVGGAPLPQASRMALSPLIIDRRERAFWFCDASWRLYRGALDGGHLSLLADGVLACGWSHEGLVTIERAAQALELVERGGGGVTRIRLFDLPVRASAGFIAFDGHGRVELTAVTAGDGHWALRALPGTPQQVTVDAEAPVFGATMVRGKPCLLVRAQEGDGEGDGDRLDFIHGTEPVASLYFPGPVEHACIQPVGNLIAAQVGGRLYVVRRGDSASWAWTWPPGGMRL